MKRFTKLDWLFWVLWLILVAWIATDVFGQGGTVTVNNAGKTVPPITILTMNGTNLVLTRGSGNPNSVVTAGPGSLYMDTSGDFWIKTSGTGNTGWTHPGAGAAPTPPENLTTTDAATNTQAVDLIAGHDTSGTPSGGFGSSILFRGQDSTTPDVDMGQIGSTWNIATHASRKGVVRIQGAGTTGLDASGVYIFPNSSLSANDFADHGTGVINAGGGYHVSNTFNSPLGNVLMGDSSSYKASPYNFPSAVGAGGNVMTSTGVNWISAPPTGGGIGGSIADQQVAFGVGTNIGGSDFFYWDLANNELGIGGSNGFGHIKWNDGSSSFYVIAPGSTPLFLQGSGISIGTDQVGTHPFASSGGIRLQKNFSVNARNNANSADIPVLSMSLSGSDNVLSFGDPAFTNGVLNIDIEGGALDIAIGSADLGLTSAGTMEFSGGAAKFDGTVQIANYTTNGFVKTNSSNGTLFIDTGTYGTGTVTSITATAPVVVTPSPLTTTGTISITGSALTKTDDTNVTLTLGGTPTTALLQATSLTLGWTGQLAVGRGGTGVSSLGNITKTDDTNVTLTLGGTPTGAVINSTSFTLGWAGTLGVSRGGTGAATFPAHNYFGNNTGSTAAPAPHVIDYSELSGTPTIPSDISGASYITKVAEAGLSNEFALGSLATGLLKNTTTTGVPTIAIAKTDYWDTTDFVASGGSHAHGLVPDPGSSAGTTKFLREDATWVVPSGGGGSPGGSNTQYQYNNSSTFGGVPSMTYDGTIPGTVTLTPASNTYATGFLLTDTTAAPSSGNQQYSPSILFHGNGWKTQATAASRTVEGRLALVPVQGVTGPTSNLTYSTSANGGAFTNLFIIKMDEANDGGQIQASTSSAGAGEPAFSFTSDSDTGMYDVNANVLGFSAGGSESLETSATQTWSLGNLGMAGNSSTPLVVLRPLTGALQLTTGTAANWAQFQAGTTAASATVGDGLVLSIINVAGAGANGLGIGTKYQIETSTTDNVEAGMIDVVWADATHATRTAYMDFDLVNSAAADASKMRLFGSGGLSVNNTTDPGAGIISANTGYWVGTAASTSGKILKSDGSKFTASTETYAAPGTNGNIMTSDGTNWTSSAPAGGGTISDTAFASSWNGVTTVAPSKNAVYDEIHLFDTSDDGTIISAGTGFRIGGAAASGKILIGNGTNYVASTPTYPNSGGTVGTWPVSDGTNFVGGEGGQIICPGTCTAGTGSSTSGTPATAIAEIAASANHQLIAWSAVASQVNAANTQMKMIITYSDSSTTTAQTGASSAGQMVATPAAILSIANNSYVVGSNKAVTDIRIETLGTGTGARNGSINVYQVPR